MVAPKKKFLWGRRLRLGLLCGVSTARARSPLGSWPRSDMPVVSGFFIFSLTQHLMFDYRAMCRYRGYPPEGDALSIVSEPPGKLPCSDKILSSSSWRFRRICDFGTNVFSPETALATLHPSRNSNVMKLRKPRVSMPPLNSFSQWPASWMLSSRTTARRLTSHAMFTSLYATIARDS